MSCSAGGHFDGGILGESGMVSNLILDSDELKPSYALLVHKIYLSKVVATQFRTSYDDYRKEIAVWTGQDGVPKVRCKG